MECTTIPLFDKFFELMKTDENEDTFIDVLWYKHETPCFITDKQKLNCSNFLDIASEVTDNFHYVPTFENICILREELNDLYNVYMFNQNEYIKICSKILQLIENEFLNNFELTENYFLKEENIEETKELIRLIDCSSKYNESLFKYKDRLVKLNHL